MICKNCQLQNADNSVFCMQCGASLNKMESAGVNQSTHEISSMQNQMNNNTANSQQPVNENQSYQTLMQPQSHEVMSFTEYCKILNYAALKPFSTLNNEKNKLDTFKNSAMLSIITATFATLITLIKTMYNAVKVTSGGWFSEEETKWVWENLKDVEYLKVITTNILIFLGIILAVASVYYIASLIIKKQVNFSRLLGIAAISVVPLILCSFILAPLLSMMYAPLGMVITIIGAVYTWIMVYETTNSEIIIEGNPKYYFNLICLSIVSLIIYYLYMNVLMSSISSSMNNILDILK